MSQSRNMLFSEIYKEANEVHTPIESFLNDCELHEIASLFEKNIHGTLDNLTQCRGELLSIK